MPDGGTFTIRLAPNVERRLAALSARLNRSPDHLIADAVAAYLQGEEAVMAGIRQGLADLDAGNIVDHDAAMDEVDAVIQAAAGQRTR